MYLICESTYHLFGDTITVHIVYPMWQSSLTCFIIIIIIIIHKFVKQLGLYKDHIVLNLLSKI